MRHTVNRHQSPQGGGGFIPPQPPPQAQQPAQQSAPVPPTTIVREAERSYAAPPPPPPPGQYVQPQPGQQIQGQQPLTMDAVFPNDPNLPPELRGRPVRDALDAYQTMRQDFLQRNGVRPPQQVPPTPQQPQAPQGQQPQAQRPGQPTNPRDSFFRDPEGAIDSRLSAFENRLLERFGPVFQQTNQVAIERALSVVRSEYPDFSRHEGAIMAQLKNAPPEILANPESFRAAYRYVLGDEALRARQAQPQRPAAQAWVPANGQPQTPAQQFFTEAPTPQASAPTESGITPQVVEMARRFRMAPEEYVAWSGGNVPPTQGASGNGRR